MNEPILTILLSSILKGLLLPRVISEELYQNLIKDYQTLLDTTTIKAASDTIQDRIDKLKICPIFRKGQDYAD